MSFNHVEIFNLAAKIRLFFQKQMPLHEVVCRGILPNDLQSEVFHSANESSIVLVAVITVVSIVQLAKGIHEPSFTDAKSKMPDLNAFTLKSAMSMVAGTARSMGIKVEGEFPENI